MKTWRLVTCVPLVLAAGSAASWAGQPSSADVMEEIVVTAPYPAQPIEDIVTAEHAMQPIEEIVVTASYSEVLEAQQATELSVPFGAIAAADRVSAPRQDRIVLPELDFRL